MNINEKTITLRNLEIEEKDLKGFVKYLNDFYGVKGVYPNKYRKDLELKDILKAIDNVARKKPKHEWEWDSLDRELVRDELIDMGKFDYPTQESAIKEISEVGKIYEEEVEDTVDESDVPGKIPSQVKVKLEKAVSQIKDSNLTYPQRLKVLSHVLDSLDIDKKELTKMTTRLKGTLEGVNEDIEPQTKKIASLTGTRPDAVKHFVSKHALNITKLLKFIEKGKLSDRMDFSTALVGKDGNPIQKKMIKMFQESVVTEGKKRFDIMHGVGSSKYVINYHDGVKKHKDGSDFFDIKTFKNQKDLESFKKELLSKGYIAESVNEDTKKRFDVDFYKGDGDRQTSQEEIIRGDKFSDVVSQATKIAKSKGMNYVELYYKDAFIGSIDKKSNYTFKKGRNSEKSPLSVNESELKLGVKYINKQGKEGFIQTGGSKNPKNWFWFDGKTKHPYDTVKKELKPSKDQKKTGFGDYLKQGGRVWDNVNKDGESVNEDFKSVVGKKIYSNGSGKLFFGYEKEDDSVHLVDYNTWKKLTAKNLSNEFMANRLINAIVKGQKQFNKKVDYNMWSNKTKPSFEQRMDYFIKNGWISNINKGGIKEAK